MIAMSLSTLMIKDLVFIFIKPPLFKRLEVDTQQLIFPKSIILWVIILNKWTWQYLYEYFYKSLIFWCLCQNI